MHFRAAQTHGNWIYHHISSIRYKVSLIFHLTGDTYADYPTDLLAFSLVIYFVLRSNAYSFQMSNLFRVVAQDTTHYFLVIFTSHLVLELTLVFGAVSIMSCHPVFSFSLTKIFLALIPATPFCVSDTRIYFFQLFIAPSFVEQWNHRVCLKACFFRMESNLNRLLGFSQ